MSDNDTHTQWAIDFLNRFTAPDAPQCNMVDELAAVKRAAELWRAEALAADAVYSAYLNDQPVLESEVAWDEKIRARIAAGLK